MFELNENYQPSRLKRVSSSKDLSDVLQEPVKGFKEYESYNCGHSNTACSSRRCSYDNEDENNQYFNKFLDDKESSSIVYFDNIDSLGGIEQILCDYPPNHPLAALNFQDVKFDFDIDISICGTLKNIFQDGFYAVKNMFPTNLFRTKKN